jgi:hypothetical protein
MGDNINIKENIGILTQKNWKGVEGRNELEALEL